MPSLSTTALFGIVPFLALVSFLRPHVELSGVLRPVVSLNNERCTVLQGLEACEDAWVSEAAGVAYLPCSDRATRLNWTPALLFLNDTALPERSTDYVALYDFTTGSITKLDLVGLPPSSRGIFVHAIDVWVDPSDATSLTVFLNSHRPQAEPGTSASLGADSVVEIFETRLGSHELKWVKTVKDPLQLRTPNNLVAVGPRSFYASNDHALRVSWKRHFEVLYPIPTSIVYCDASNETPKCIEAVDGLAFPNGIAKGPGNILYSADSMRGNVRVWEAQPNHTLSLLKTLPLPRLTDNIHVAPNGDLFAATFPKILHFMLSQWPSGHAKNRIAPVEVWKIANVTGTPSDAELVFGDDGNLITGTTTASPYKNQILLTGAQTKAAVLCVLP